MKAYLEKAKALIQGKKRGVVLTGAGISTPSGIPDFRSPGSGIWEKVNPAEVATIWAYEENPKKVLSFLAPFTRQILEARPNAAHLAVQALEEKGVVKCVITQNIDGLHQKAGSKKVLELHGNIRECLCLRCHTVRPLSYLTEKLEALKEEETKPLCSCGGLLKPQVIFFGEALPHATLEEAREAAEQADLFLVIGSSLTVQPASLLPYLALRHGAKLLIVNIQPTYLNEEADLTVSAPVELFLPALVETLE